MKIEHIKFKFVVLCGLQPLQPLQPLQFVQRSCLLLVAAQHISLCKLEANLLTSLTTHKSLLNHNTTQNLLLAQPFPPHFY